jgi:hypothetical protein
VRGELEMLPEPSSNLPRGTTRVGLDLPQELGRAAYLTSELGQGQIKRFAAAADPKP